MGKGNIGFTVMVKCQRCGKVGDDRDIPTVTFPDGIDRILCYDCFKIEAKTR